MTSQIKYLDISALSEAGIVNKSNLPNALRAIRNGAFWHDWGLKALLALGVGHILAGIIFFFAYNWNDLTPFLKFAIVQGAIVLSVIAWILTKLDKASAAFGITATVLIGVLLAVMGQVYQTPAKLYTLFAYWAVLSLPFAFASRSHAHWTVWIAIALFGFCQYVGTSVSQIHGHPMAATVILGTALLFLGGLALYNRLLTDRGRGQFWFRMLLLTIALGLTFAAFTYAFWHDPKVHLVYIGAICVFLAVIFYLYKLRPSIAGLSLASFGLIASIGQTVFEVFSDFAENNSLVLQVLIIAIWFILLTVLLAFLFRHYLKTFNQDEEIVAEIEIEKTLPNLSRAEFSQQSGIELADIGKALAEHDNNTPWYMELFLGICGVLTAIIVGCFVGLLFMITFSFDDVAIFIPVGAIILALAVFLRRKTNSIYTSHLLNTFIMAGGALLLIGSADILEERLIGVLAFGLSVGVMLLVKDRILEFILGFTAILGVAGIFAFDLEEAAAWIAALIAIIMATALFLYPLKRQLYISGAFGMLTAGTILCVFMAQSFGYATEEWHNDLIGKILLLAAFVGSIYWVNRRMGLSLSKLRPHVWVLIPLMLAVAILPIGAATPLLIMLLGFIIGSWPFALIGILFQIYFLWLFYYDLSVSLLHKSILLVVTGLILVGLWAFVSRPRPKILAAT